MLRLRSTPVGVESHTCGPCPGRPNERLDHSNPESKTDGVRTRRTTRTSWTYPSPRVAASRRSLLMRPSGRSRPAPTAIRTCQRREVRSARPSKTAWRHVTAGASAGATLFHRECASRALAARPTGSADSSPRGESPDGRQRKASLGSGPPSRVSSVAAASPPG